MAQKIILASASQGRQNQLKRAGLVFEVKKPTIDEEALAFSLQGEPLRDIAEQLAIAKGVEVSRLYPKAVVLAGDQICTLGGEVFDKPITHQNAAQQLEQLQGKTHHLHTSACICLGGEVLWQFTTTTAMHMRPLTFDEIEAYVTAEDVRYCCGSYKIEGRGMRLFSRIDGDHFAIEGLPLLDVINALYEQGFIGLV